MSASRTLFVMATAFGVVSALSTPPVVLASSGRHPGGGISDSRIKAQVRAALDADTRLRGSGVFVQSVNDGVVVLAGRARTMSDHLRATGDAVRVPGVHRVANEVEVQERTSPETDGDHGTPDSVRDTWTRSATEARARADSPSPGLGLVNVDTHNGAVTLFGTAPPAKVEAAVEEKVRKTSARVAGKARDQDLERAVREALKDRHELTDTSIDVDVKHGVVRLTGTVPTEAQRRTAALSAKSVAGVKSVREALRVSGR
jgi:osmotically-inducible protein OsmY